MYWYLTCGSSLVKSLWRSFGPLSLVASIIIGVSSWRVRKWSAGPKHAWKNQQRHALYQVFNSIEMLSLTMGNDPRGPFLFWPEILRMYSNQDTCFCSVSCYFTCCCLWAEVGIYSSLVSHVEWVLISHYPWANNLLNLHVFLFFFEDKGSLWRTILITLEK